LNYGGEWLTFYANYNNLSEGMSRMFALKQTANWMFNMYRFMDSTEPNSVPEFKSNPVRAVYHVLAICFISFFVLNLFSGVVVSTFNAASR
jgi:hypothetical protein